MRWLAGRLYGNPVLPPRAACLAAFWVAYLVAFWIGLPWR